MADNRLSKRIQISKASTVITITLGVAAFVTVAGLVASRALWQQRTYQAKVIKEKELAALTLKSNIAAVDTLVTSYKEFIGRPQNIIGGDSAATGERDGNNAKIVLDALPSKYDFPGLISSLEKVLKDRNFEINTITGTDDEVAQSTRQSESPEVVEMPFVFSVSGNYDAIQDLLLSLERSIRPLHLRKLTLSADSGGLQMEVDAKTFYQSEKLLQITTKVVD